MTQIPLAALEEWFGKMDALNERMQSLCGLVGPKPDDLLIAALEKSYRGCKLFVDDMEKMHAARKQP